METWVDRCQYFRQSSCKRMNDVKLDNTVKSLVSTASVVKLSQTAAVTEVFARNLPSVTVYRPWQDSVSHTFFIDSQSVRDIALQSVRPPRDIAVQLTSTYSCHIHVCLIWQASSLVKTCTKYLEMFLCKKMKEKGLSNSAFTDVSRLTTG